MAKRKNFHAYQDFDYTYRGGAGNDRITSGLHNDIIIGGKGNDRLGDAFQPGLAVGSDDVFTGGQGDDTIFSYSGDDFIFGGQGDDMVGILDIGNDLAHVFVDGGSGTDVVKLANPGDGEWVRIADPGTEQTFSVEGREVTVINVELLYM